MQHVGSYRLARPAKIEYPWAIITGAILTVLCAIPISYAAYQALGSWLSQPFYIGYIVASWGLLLAAAWHRKKQHSSGLLELPVWQALNFTVLNILLIQGSKFLFELPRPGSVSTGAISGHTAYAVGLAWLVAAHYPRLALFWFSMAAAIGWAHIASNAHYPYQVFAGLLIGTALGWGVTQRENSALESLFKPRRCHTTASENSAQDGEQSPTRLTRLRLRLTGLGGVALFIVSWQWGRADWLPWVFPLGAILAAIGLLLRVWATGWLIKNEALTTSGPYSLTRNPLYLGTLLITTGQCMMSDVPWAPFFFPALCLTLYWTTMRQEEAYLRSRYGTDYEAYEQRVPLLLPTWKWALNRENFSSPQQFSWRRVRRCYKGFVANAVVMLVYAMLHFAR